MRLALAILGTLLLTSATLAQGSYGGYATAHTHRHVVRHYHSYGSMGGTYLRPRLFNRYAEGPVIVRNAQPVRSTLRAAATIATQPVRSARTVLRRVCDGRGCRLVEVPIDEAMEAASATQSDPPAEEKSVGKTP